MSLQNLQKMCGRLPTNRAVGYSAAMSVRTEQRRKVLAEANTTEGLNELSSVACYAT